MSDRIHLSGCPVGQEITPECEVVCIENEGDLDVCIDECPKKGEHDSFIPVNKFTPENLPAEFRTDKMMQDIYKTSALTLRVRVPYTSIHRPDFYDDSQTPYPYTEYKGDNTHVRYGTGSIVEVLYYQPIKGKPCPCPPCKKSDNPKMLFWWIHARSATHVIFDKFEAQQAEFDCFYDIDDKEGGEKRQGIKTIYGIDAFMVLIGAGNKYPNDVFDVLCVTHDHETIAVLNNIMPPDYFLYPPSPYKVSSSCIVSHPHGGSKKISIGKIIHQTVPVGSKFPVNTPIPFEKGTKQRESSLPDIGKLQTGEEKSTPTATGKEKEEAVSEETTGERYAELLWTKNIDVQLNELKETLKASDIYHHYERMVDEANISRASLTPRTDSNEKYLVDFYFIYMTEKILKILLMAAIKNRKSKGESADHNQLVTDAYTEVFRVFLEKEYDPYSHPTSHPTTSDPVSVQSLGAEGSKHIPQIQHWINLLNESVEQFSNFKSNKGGEKTGEESGGKVTPLIVAWFDEIGKIMDSTLSKSEQEEGVKIEDLLPKAGEMILRSGLSTITNFETRQTAPVPTQGDTATTPGKSETSVQHEEESGKTGDGAAGGTDDGAADTGAGHVVEKQVSDGSTFTLPPNAEYAFRVYSHSPGWISFPINTIMTMPDGTRKDIGGPQALEFQFPTVLPEFSYVTYDINTCPGTSGANIFCNILEKSIGTYFPHSGYDKQNGMNKSGIRDNLFALYNRSFMFSQNSGQDKSMADPGIIDFSKTLLQGQLHMLQKL